MTRMDYLRAEGYSDSEAVVIAFNECCLTPKPEELLRWPGWVGEFFRNLAVDELLSAPNQEHDPAKTQASPESRKPPSGANDREVGGGTESLGPAPRSTSFPASEPDE